MARTKVLIALHLMLGVYSLCSVFAKLASGYPVGSPYFLLCYALMIALLGLYAIGWQQFIKRMPLSVAYANKAVTVLWGGFWGILLFHEQLSAGKVVGGLLVLVGIALFGYADGKAVET